MEEDHKCSKCGEEYHDFSSSYWKIENRVYTCPECLGYDEDFYAKEFEQKKSYLPIVLIITIIVTCSIIFLIGGIIWTIPSYEDFVWFVQLLILTIVLFFLVRGFVLFRSTVSRTKLKGVATFTTTSVIVVIGLTGAAIFSGILIFLDSDTGRALVIPGWLITFILVFLFARALLKD